MNTILIRFINKYKDSSIVVRASFWFLLVTIIDKGISIITQPIINRILSVEEVGIFGVYMLFQRKLPKFFSSKLIGLYLVIIVILTASHFGFFPDRNSENIETKEQTANNEKDEENEESNEIKNIDLIKSISQILETILNNNK